MLCRDRITVGVCLCVERECVCVRVCRERQTERVCVCVEREQRETVCV